MNAEGSSRLMAAGWRMSRTNRAGSKSSCSRFLCRAANCKCLLAAASKRDGRVGGAQGQRRDGRASGGAHARRSGSASGRQGGSAGQGRPAGGQGTGPGGQNATPDEQSGPLPAGFGPRRPQRLQYQAPSVDGGTHVEISQGPGVNEEYARVGRNDPCPCGSGRKYKRCHGDPRMRDA